MRVFQVKATALAKFYNLTIHIHKLFILSFIAQCSTSPDLPGDNYGLSEISQSSAKWKKELVQLKKNKTKNLKGTEQGALCINEKWHLRTPAQPDKGQPTGRVSPR